MRFFSLLLALLMQIMGIMELPFAQANPVQPADTRAGADPFVVECDGETYYTYTDGGYSISISKVASLDDLTPIDRKTVYNPGHCCFVYRDNGDIYMVYHATDKEVFSETRVTYKQKLEFVGNYPLFNVK